MHTGKNAGHVVLLELHETDGASFHLYTCDGQDKFNLVATVLSLADDTSTKYLDPARNASGSFRYFCQGLATLG